MFKKIIVGMDFSETSERAARAAMELAAGLGAEVVLVHVLPSGADYADAGGFVEKMRPNVEAEIKACVQKLSKGSAVRIDWGIVDGRPAEEIVSFATKWGGDMIVTGTAGKGGVTRMILGSVAERIVRMATVPVLVVGPEK